MFNSDDANKKPEDASYTVDVLTRCKVLKDEIAKKTITILPLKEPGEPAVISIPISQANSSLCCYSQISLWNLLFTLRVVFFSWHSLPTNCCHLKEKV